MCVCVYFLTNYNYIKSCFIPSPSLWWNWYHLYAAVRCQWCTGIIPSACSHLKINWWKSFLWSSIAVLMTYHFQAKWATLFIRISHFALTVITKICLEWIRWAVVISICFKIAVLSLHLFFALPRKFNINIVKDSHFMFHRLHWCGIESANAVWVSMYKKVFCPCKWL